jgi:tetratricopeptide (TPR) repeat protein
MQRLFEAEQALSLAPDDADSFATLAEIRTVAGAPFEALTELERVQGTKLAHSRLYPRALGRSLFATGRFAEAAVALERAIALKPGDKAALEAADGHLWLSRARRGRRRHGRRPHRGRAAQLSQSRRQLSLQMAEFESVTQLPGDRSLLLNGLRLAGIPN